jgi:hypothetical protein
MRVVADNVVTALRGFSANERATRYRSALRPGKADGPGEIPAQTKELPARAVLL